ncbi:WG repeat-containing protein [Dehalobacterium formicoaceticum]|uniref:WG repeat-containing protein n=1 Tax=Dehalobacterium formicoaceticum TaxID=51515 RepID=A0ABT1Y6P8_9FIRM|nr:WG repeat-containing protein [Dehalobacterium formicoaceticum]MCR6546560.1 WG repeat-containing protein [Dehalobacterium formicoaceticum]
MGNHKKIAISLLLFFSLGIMGGCSNNVANQPEGSDLLQPQDVAGIGLYGEIRQKLPDFVITPEIKEWDQPLPFYEDGKLGFKDKQGKIVLEPIYASHHGYRNGVNNIAYDDEAGNRTWQVYDIYGKPYPYDTVYGFHYGISFVQKDGKSGLINTAGQEIVPVEYDKLLLAYIQDAASETEQPSAYAQKDSRSPWVLLDLQDGYQSYYEPYDENKKAGYAGTLDLTEHSVAIINNMIMVDGISLTTGKKFPLCALDGLSCQIYQDGKAVGSAPIKLDQGFYEGEVMALFPDYFGESYVDENNEFVAIPQLLLSQSQPSIAKGQGSDYQQAVEDYLTEKQIENTPVKIASCYIADFSGQNKKSALLEVVDTMRFQEPLPPEIESWDADDFTAKKVAFVSTILFIPDLTKPNEYQVVLENIQQSDRFIRETIRNSLYAAFDLDRDGSLEMIVDNLYYEYRDYQLIDLSK